MTGNRKISKQEPDASIEKDWTQNKSLSGIDPAKLQFLNSIAAQGSQKGMQELLPFLMSAVAQNQNQSWNERGMLFREYNPIIEDYSPEQLKIINSTIAVTDDN